MSETGIRTILAGQSTEKELRSIAEKVLEGERITRDEGLLLYKRGEPGYLAVLADHVRERMNGAFAYFNRNIHIEPTNLCILKCKFCSYYRNEGEEGCWELDDDKISRILEPYGPGDITEVHIVSGVHPRWTITEYAGILQTVRRLRPEVHIKAYTAVELDFMFRKARLTPEEGFTVLRQAGLDSIPGGGAEILDAGVRKQLCPEKISGERWLAVHRAAHLMQVPSNATMLYGHLEAYAHRVDHLDRLRTLQDETGGFNAFIPLKFRRAHNQFSHLKEVSVIEDLKNFAICRIYLDNFPHIKAYWPMIGKQTAAISLAFGVDDLDGTIDDSTRIYSMAGAEDKHPSMNTEEMVDVIRSAGRIPVERDSLYNPLQKYTA